MRILLPPSETKRSGGHGRFTDDALRNSEALADARVAVRRALVSLSQDAEAAAKPLKLGKKNQGELAHNLALESSGVMPAIDRYTGVLYDALDAGNLGESERAWVAAHVRVQSALFGLIGADDPIPAYRLSAGSRLPDLSRPLKRVWSEAHAGLDWSGAGLVLDLRSKDYAALAPLPDGVGHALNVAQRGEDGRVRALNHFNKAAKGDLVRRLAADRATPETVADLLAWAAGAGLELHLDDAASGAPAQSLTLVTELGVPAAA